MTSANRRAQDDDNVVAPRRVLLAQEGHHVTPTNIEDAIGKFREGGDGGDPAFVAEKEALFPARAKALQHDLSAYYKQRRGTQNLRKSSPWTCLLYTSPSPRDKRQSRMPSSA